MKFYHVFLAKFENARLGKTFDKYIILPDDMDYEDAFRAALALAFEYQNPLPDPIFRGLMYLEGVGLSSDAKSPS